MINSCIYPREEIIGTFYKSIFDKMIFLFYIVSFLFFFKFRLIIITRKMTNKS